MLIEVLNQVLREVATFRKNPKFSTRPYSKFVGELQKALLAPEGANILGLLDGLAGQNCLKLITNHSLQFLGAFFTPSAIAEKIVKEAAIQAWDDEIVFDPACGAADLLLPIARRLPVAKTVSETLRRWNRQLCGCDLSAEFIDAARLRLMLLAVERGAVLDGDANRLSKILSNLVVGDGLRHGSFYSASSFIIMPPLQQVRHGSAKMEVRHDESAAVFVDKAIQASKPGTNIAVLLPEVLRTGTSYRNWRAHISATVESSKPKSIGQFSSDADVDVFIQYFIKREGLPKKKNARRGPEIEKQSTISFLFQ